MDPTDMDMSFRCASTDLAVVHPGVNSMLVSASFTPVMDIWWRWRPHSATTAS
jgi:hypothetical protein